MADYKKLYLLLFNACTDCLQELDSGNIFLAKQFLIDAQRKAEEIFIETEVHVAESYEEKFITLKRPKDKEQER